MSVSHIAPPPRRTTLKADETRELILGAAELRFAATGFYPCRLEDIAEDVGITRTAVIYHFQDKETLYNAVLEKLFTQLNDRISMHWTYPLACQSVLKRRLKPGWISLANARPSCVSSCAKWLARKAVCVKKYSNTWSRCLRA
jgi:AcrR family transcriptional regulator